MTARVEQRVRRRATGRQAAIASAAAIRPTARGSEDEGRYPIFEPRSCGNRGTRVGRTIVSSEIDATAPGKVLVGVNANQQQEQGTDRNRQRYGRNHRQVLAI
ncbi:hypothetical protein ACW4TU_35265 [Streptomyces sp. QTS52]